MSSSVFKLIVRGKHLIRVEILLVVIHGSASTFCLATADHSPLLLPSLSWAGAFTSGSAVFETLPSRAPTSSLWTLGIYDLFLP